MNETEWTVTLEDSGFSFAEQAEAYLTRGFLFLEDREFTNAERYFEKCLDLTPTEDRAYIGLLLAELRLPKESLLLKEERDFTTNTDFAKALRFAPAERKNTYLEYQQLAEERRRQDEQRRQELRNRQYRTPSPKYKIPWPATPAVRPPTQPNVKRGPAPRLPQGSQSIGPRLPRERVPRQTTDALQQFSQQELLIQEDEQRMALGGCLWIMITVVVLVLSVVFKV